MADKNENMGVVPTGYVVADGIPEGYQYKKTFGEKVLDVLSSGHLYGDQGPEGEVKFTPEGKMTVNDVPTGDPGLFGDPVTWAAMGGFAGVKATGGLISKAAVAAREALGWATGGASEVPALVKGGAKALAKGAEAKNLAETAAERAGKPFAEVPVEKSAQVIDKEMAATKAAMQNNARGSLIDTISAIGKTASRAEQQYDTLAIYGKDALPDAPNIKTLIDRNFMREPSPWLKDFQIIGEPQLTQEAQDLVRRAKITIESTRAAGPKAFRSSKLSIIDPQLNEDLGKFLERNTAPGFNAFIGSAAGVKQDENGDWYVDPKIAAIGAGVSIGAFKLFKTAGRNGVVDTNGWQADSVKVAEKFNQEQTARYTMNKPTLDRVKKAMTRTLLDTSGNIKKAAIKIDPDFGTELAMRKELIPGASARASNMIEQYNSAIFKNLNQADHELLNSIIEARRIIQIDEYKGIGVVAHPLDVGGVEHINYIDDLKNTLDPAKYADLEARSNIYFDAMHDQLTMLKNEGIISPNSYQELSQYLYSPRKFMQYMDDLHTGIRGGKPITQTEKGIKPLKEGSEQFLYNDATFLLNQHVQRTQDMIFRNRANIALHDFAEANPGNGIVELSKIAKSTKAGKPVYQNAPGGFEKVSVQINGEHKEMIMPAEWAKEWVVNDPLVNQTMATAIQWITGTAPLKAMATGYNPAFAVTNLARDMALIWNATTEYSAHLPIATGQMARDMAVVAKDVATRGARVKAFINEGGSMDFLTYQGRFSGTGDLKEKLSNVGEYLGWVGETSELWTRVALRERALKNGANPTQATWTARKYLDFSQGGNIAKGLDNGLPYLNASIQGTRSVFRAAKENPALFAYKFSQIAALSAGIYMANRSVNPEVLDEVSERDKVSYFIITTPWKYTDASGQERSYYIKIAKDQGQRSISSLIEGTLEYLHTGKYPTNQQKMAAGDAVGIGWPPLASMALAFQNHDTWTGQPVWNKDRVEPSQEFTQNTNPMAKAVGAVGLSPARTQVAFSKIVPSNNFFTGLVGWGVKQIFDGLDPDVAKKTMGEILASAPGINRVLGATSPINAFQENVDNTRTAETTRRFQQHRELDGLSARYFQDQSPDVGKKIHSFITSAPEEDQKRLSDRFETYAKTAQLPDRAWWVTVSGLDNNSKAIEFTRRWNKSQPEEKLRMIQVANRVGSFSGDGFIDALRRVQEGNK